jgi:hypothetical protein
MKKLLAGALLATGLSLAGSPLVAQTSGEWWNPVTVGNGGGVLEGVILGRPSDNSGGSQGRVPTTYDPRYDQNQSSRGKAKQGNGPPFCRNGQGHPVHGRGWCEAKGWAPANWNQVNWGNVVLGGRLPQQQRTVNQATIGDILGSVILGRVSSLARSSGLSGPMDGRWIPLNSGGSVLQLRVAGVPIAEFADVNRDRRADVVFVNHIR